MSKFSGFIPGFDDPDELFGTPAGLGAPEEVKVADEPHEHRLISGMLAMILYFGGGLAIIIALVLIFAPATLAGVEDTISSFVAAMGRMLHDIGSTFGLK